MARRTARKQGRGAVPADSSRIRNEVAAIALVAFAVLSLVALFADANAVLLHWWRSFLFASLGWGALFVPVVLGALAGEMWFGLLRRSMAAPIGGGFIAYTALLALLQHYQRGDVASGDGAGGFLGSALASAMTRAFGDVGGPVVLVFMLLVGIVVAANRTLAELVRPAWSQRGRMSGVRPGVSLPGGTGTRFARELPEAGGDIATGDALAEPMRINLPPDRPKAPRAAEAPQRPPLRVVPPTGGGALEPSIDGLPQAEVAAEGVLHAMADKEWTLPPLDLLAGGDHGKSGGPEEIKRNATIIEETRTSASWRRSSRRRSGRSSRATS